MSFRCLFHILLDTGDNHRCLYLMNVFSDVRATGVCWIRSWSRVFARVQSCGLLLIFNAVALLFAALVTWLNRVIHNNGFYPIFSGFVLQQYIGCIIEAAVHMHEPKRARKRPYHRGWHQYAVFGVPADVTADLQAVPFVSPCRDKAWL